MTDISFPEHSMSGVALEYANLYSQYLETPKEFFYFAFLTCLGNTIGDVVRLEGELATQPRLFVCTLGESSDARKSTGNSKTTEFFRSTFPNDFAICTGVNSAEGLVNVVKDDEKVMLYLDEFQHFINKASIKTSTLLDTVNSLFGDNRMEIRKSQENEIIEPVYLSMLGASTLQTYEKMWTPAFIDIGFTNRLFIVTGSSNKRVARPKSIPETSKASIREKLYSIHSRVKGGYVIPMTVNADHIYKEWYDDIKRSSHTKRLEEYALRLMTLYALSEQSYEVNKNVVKKVLDMVHWQLMLRIQYDPIDADNKIAELEQKIKKKLFLSPLPDREIKTSTNAYRYGMYIYKCAMKQLEEQNEIKFDKELKRWKLTQDSHFNGM